jgi:REP element-mobilizing transposase RayT
MANTYSQIYIQVVFAVSGRMCLISKDFEAELYKYITGIVKGAGQKLIAINGRADHIHILLGIKPNMALSDLVGKIKASSTNFINSKKWVRGRFSWQEGFGAFSYSHSQLTEVIRYIQNQDEHHSVKSFKDEYQALLKKFEVEYDDKYVFKWIDDD